MFICCNDVMSMRYLRDLPPLSRLTGRTIGPHSQNECRAGSEIGLELLCRCSDRDISSPLRRVQRVSFVSRHTL